ncbi:MAG: histidine kinase, partial [Muribaculaceae bacterium]|nr:histidine kinase [Muribaculaceae bacterium]
FDRLMGMLAELALLDIIAYVNIIFLFRDFKRHHNLKKYLKNVAVLVIAVLVPLVVFQALTIKPSLYSRGTPVLLVLGILSSMTTLSMFVAGISAALLLQDWISGQQRVTMLQAETVRQEYAFLKKQINPHFLFNVLNNVGILSEEEPAEASGMLAELQKLVEYQFSETDNNNTTLRREIEFLSSYLALERTRIEPFSYEITSDGNVDDVVVPTLLFIPFVENAVKYGAVVDGRRDLKVSFSRCGDFLEFQCENTFRPRSARSGRPGGLGISNTLRRLNLLFGDKYSYSRETGSGRYKAYLRIPLKKLSRKEL